MPPCLLRYSRRIAVDTAKDPISHNLWPFELIIAAVIGILVSAAGALVGSVPAFFSRHNREGAALEPTSGGKVRGLHYEAKVAD